jgi:hypothetical protein
MMLRKTVGQATQGGEDMIDPRDPEQAEQAAWCAPEAALRRRDFLQQAASKAGLGLGAAAVLAPETLVSAAAAKQPRPPMPFATPRWAPVAMLGRRAAGRRTRQ